MIDTLAEKMALSLKKMNVDETASVEVMKFSLIAILNAASILILTATAGYITGKPWDTFLALTAFAVLRMFSGGYHLHSSDLCVAVSTLLFAAIPHIPMNTMAVFVLNGVSFILVFLFAPSRIENQTRIPPKYYPLLKIISALLVAVNFYLLSPAIALSFSVQALSLTVKGGE
jgi:accessory gene regulator B